MKITLSVPELKKVIKPMSALVNATTVLPILECGLFEYRAGTLKISVTDLETIVSAKITLASSTVPKDPFCFCVQWSLFRSAINNCETDSIDLTYENKVGVRVILSNDDFKIKLPVEDHLNYPKSPGTIIAPDFNISIAASDFLPQLFTAIQFASNDDLRPGMTGVCLCNAGDKMHLVATDAHRLYKKPLLDKSSPLLVLRDKKWIIPKKSAKILRTLFKTAFTIKADTGFMECFNNEYHIIFRLIDAKYPEWQSVWPKDKRDTFIAKRKKFKAMLIMAMPFTNVSTSQVSFTLNQNSMEVNAGDVDFNYEFQYKMPVFENSSQEAHKIAFNSRFLYQALTISKDDNVKISYAGPANPIIIDDEVLIMPLILNN